MGRGIYIAEELLVRSSQQFAKFGGVRRSQKFCKIAYKMFYRMISGYTHIVRRKQN